MNLLRFVLVLAVLCAPAVLPTIAVVGPRLVVLPLLLPIGGLLAAVAAVAAIATRTSMTPWVVVVDALAVAAALMALRQRRTTAAGRWSVTSGATSSLVTAAAVAAAGLSPLRRPAIDWDARSIWMLHARLLRAGGGHYVAALHDRAYAFAHVDYPPLVPATIAVGWKAWGASSYRVAQVVLALQGASLIVLAAWLVARQVRVTRPGWLAPALAGVFTVAAVGASAAYLTNGYADVVPAAAATVAALALLVEEPGAAMTGVGLAAAATAALTKDEGLVAALLVVGLWVLRLLVARHRVRLLLVGGGVAGALVVAWPILIAALGGPHGSVLSGGAGPGGAPAAAEGKLMRLGHASWGIAMQVKVLPLVVTAAVLLAVALNRRASRAGARDGRLVAARRSASLLWLGALLVLDVAALLATYTVGSWEIKFWVASSVDRVALLPRLLLYAGAALVLGLLAEVWQTRAPVDGDDAQSSRKVTVIG